MSMLNELIKSLCSKGVEFKEIKTVLHRSKGTKITASQMREKHNPNGQVKIFAGGKTFALFNYEDLPEKDIVNEPSIVVKSRGIIEFEYYDRPFSHKNEFWSYQSRDPNINIKFVYYVLKTKEDFFQKIAGKMQMPQIALPDTEKFEIPIPPIEIQNEIAKILDLFTEMEAQLEAELGARKRQCNFYRDRLLSFDGKNVEWKTLGEIGNVCMCKRVFKEETTTSGDIPFYKIGTFGKEPDAFISKEIYHEYKKRFSFPKKGDILISASGTIGRTVIYDGEPAYFQDSNIVWINNDETSVTNKFLFHYYKIVKWQTDTGGTIVRLYNDNLKKTKIPIPSLEEQERIANILDKFDALVNDISIGLPAEIEARRKQYEYYRNRLLTFKNINNG